MKPSYDKNHHQLVKHAEALGWVVVLDGAKYGAPIDLPILARAGRIVIVEIKNPEKKNKTKETDRWRLLTPNEMEFASRCAKAKLPYYVVFDEQEIQGVLTNKPQYLALCQVNANDPKRNRDRILAQLKK